MLKNKTSYRHFYIDNQEKYYWLGFLFADGGVMNKYALSVGLSIVDKDHLENFRNFCQCHNEVKFQQDKLGYNSCRLSIYGKDLIKYLEQYGIIKQKSKFGRPQNIPEKFLGAWLLGLFDGDGSLFQTNRGDWIFSQVGNYETMLFVQKKLKEVYDLELNICKNKSIFGLRLGEYDSYCLLARLYKNKEYMCLERKYKKFLLFKDKIENKYKSLINLYK